MAPSLNEHTYLETHFFSASIDVWKSSSPNASIVSTPE